MTASVILTCRVTSPSTPLAHLLAVLSCLAQTPDLPVIVVEQDVQPRLPATLPHPACSVRFEFNPGPFNRGWGLNVGARQVRTPLVAFHDTDLLMPPAMLANAVAHCTGGYQMVKPYRRVLDLSSEATARIRPDDLASLWALNAASQAQRAITEDTAPLCAGAFVMSTSAFFGFGGWDERFAGGGGEDDALSYRVERARLPTLQFDHASAPRLWSPRSVDEGMADASLALQARYRQYSEAEFQRLAEVQAQMAGHRDKYRPAEFT